jgi:hypothetical protein
VAEPDQSGWHLPAWVKEWTIKLMPWAFMAIIGGGVGLFLDNIKNKETIDRNTWRNDKQDERDVEIIASIKRLELRQDRSEERAADKQREDEAFQGQVLDHLQRLLRLKR